MQHIICFKFKTKNLDTSGVRLHYTDSFVMTLSKPLDERVLPGREQHWQADKPKWFLMDPNCCGIHFDFAWNSKRSEI